ncbi:MAG: phosphate ABC transporter substrate-binding protein PstS [Ignavibacteria bacterium]
MKKTLFISILTILVSAAFLTGCGKSDKDEPVKELLGAGATFPYPLYSKMFDEYNKSKQIKINYQSIGSGGGIQQLTSKTVDFGASDAYLSDDQISKFPAPVVHIPTCLGAVVLTYNIEGNPTLKFTPDVISDIYMGKIKNWNDEKITKLNPDVKLPSKEINVVHRSDGSGTTFVFSTYLSRVSDDWKKSVGAGTSINWPVGLGGKGNEGVSGLVNQTPGSIGYVELIYAIQNKVPMATLQNKAGNFIVPSLKSTNAAANGTIPDDTRISLTNSDAPEGYPIVSFTWILLYKEQNYDNRSESKAKGVVNLIWWMTHEGQQYNEALSYATLTPEAVKKVEANLKSITYNGKPILQ